MSHTQQHWDIFCRVIDNYGDIGVCWRLARQLAGEYQQTTRLWLDDLTTLQRLWPQAEVYDGAQIAGVEVRHWHGNAPADAVAADIVIEAFACDIPARYIAAMAAHKAAGHPLLWIDRLYAPEAVVARSPRLLLHAEALWLSHPITQQPLNIFCPARF